MTRMRLENPDLDGYFEITCKKCGSQNCTIYGVYVHCGDCNNSYEICRKDGD